MRQQAQAEKLTLLVADNKTGYFGVHLVKPGQPKPYQAKVWRGGKNVYLGCFATAEEAALCFARSPEGQAAATRNHRNRLRHHNEQPPPSPAPLRSQPQLVEWGVDGGPQ